MSAPKPLKIGDITVQKPIIQGGMGVGISLSRWPEPWRRREEPGSFPRLRSVFGSRILKRIR